MVCRSDEGAEERGDVTLLEAGVLAVAMLLAPYTDRPPLPRAITLYGRRLPWKMNYCNDDSNTHAHEAAVLFWGPMLGPCDMM